MVTKDSLPGVPLYRNREAIAELLRADRLADDAIVMWALAERLADEAASSADPGDLLGDVQAALRHLHRAARALNRALRPIRGEQLRAALAAHPHATSARPPRRGGGGPVTGIQGRVHHTALGWEWHVTVGALWAHGGIEPSWAEAYRSCLAAVAVFRAGAVPGITEGVTR